MELLNYALNPGNDFVQEEIFNAGFESGERTITLLSSVPRSSAIVVPAIGICPLKT